MKVFLQVSVVLLLVLVGLGSAIKCYSCTDYSGSCSGTQECSTEDACLSLYERGGSTYRQCLKYSDCEMSRLSYMFPNVKSFTFRCCTSNLCNSATVNTVKSSVLGVLLSLALLWWCIL